MNKTYKYTVLTVFLALVFSFGNIICMKFILQARERQLLTESGTSVIDVPVQEWKIEGYSEPLTMEQIEDVIKCWDESTDVIEYEPVMGQITGGGAIKAGEQWLAEMGLEEGTQTESRTETVYVTLSMGIAGESKLETGIEPYYSFWRIEFTSRSFQAFLCINAVTGKVWGADIVLYENLPGEMPCEKLSRFVELAGLPASGAVSRIGGSNAFLPIDNSDLNAEMEFRYSKTGYPYSGYSRSGLLKFGRKVLDRENVNIIFTLGTGKS